MFVENEQKGEETSEEEGQTQKESSEVSSASSSLAVLQVSRIQPVMISDHEILERMPSI